MDYIPPVCMCGPFLGSGTATFSHSYGDLYE